MIAKTSTIAQLREELREWVKFRRRMADRAEDLPPASALTRLAENTITNLLTNSRIEGANPDTFTWSLFSAVYIQDPAPCIALVAHQKNYPLVIASFPLEIRHECSGSNDYPYVYDIGEPHIMGSFPTKNGLLTPKSTLEDAICCAAKHTAGLAEKEPALRWLTHVPPQVRQRHPICPHCGCQSVYIGEFCEGSKPGYLGQEVKRATCGYCSWTSARKYSYLSEFIEETSFRKELSIVRAEANAQNMVDKAKEELEAAIQRISGICQDKTVLRHATYNLELVLKRASGELSELQAEVEAYKQTRNR